LSAFLGIATSTGIAAADPPFRISNFVAGYVCERDGNQEVCRESDVIEVKGESVCDWSGEKRRCTWFGYEFDYENADPAVPLECVYERSNPSDEGGRDGLRQRKATTGEFELKLDASSGHSVNPGYEVHSVPPGRAPFDVVTRITCSYRGEPAFAQTFRARYSRRF
jgi:hypothetical protein